MTRIRAVDLCCGNGGMTRGMLAAGFEVVGVDVVARPGYPASLILADVRELDAAQLGRPEYVHASPPCTRFSLARANRATDPPTEADLDVLRACLRIIDQLKPRFWSVENVRGAVKWFRPILGEPRLRHGPFYLWGNFPPFLVARSGLTKGLHDNAVRVRDPWKRSELPPELATPLAVACAAGGA
jgi:hypothetical protein